MTDFDRTAILSGIRSHTANAQKELGDNETLRGIELIQQVLDLMPTSVRTTFNDRLEHALQTGTVHDFRVMLQTLFTTSNHTEASSFMLEAGTSTASAAGDTQLTPAQAEVQDALNGLSDKQVFWWAHRVRDSKLLNSEQDKAFVALMTAFLSGDLQVDSMGRPLAEQTLDDVQRERDNFELQITDLEQRNADLQRQLSEAQAKLTTAQNESATLRTENNRLKATAPASTPVVTGGSDELLKAVVAGVNHVGSTLGFAVPNTVRANNEPAVQSYLNGDFKTHVTTAVNDQNAKVTAANTAKTEAERKLTEARNRLNGNIAAAREANRLLADVSSKKLTAEVIGRGPVQQALAKIDPSILTPTVPLNPVS